MGSWLALPAQARNISLWHNLLSDTLTMFSMRGGWFVLQSVDFVLNIAYRCGCGGRWKYCEELLQRAERPPNI